jgi:hypothetical protein
MFRPTAVSGGDYLRAFGLIPATPEAQIGEREVISFLLFNADQLNINSMDFYSVAVSGFVPPRHGVPPRIRGQTLIVLPGTGMSRHFNA